MTDQSKIIQKMNEMGRLKIPFLFIIDFEMKNCNLIQLAEIDGTKILYCINGFSNCNRPFGQKEQILFKKYPVSKDDYAIKFNNVMKHILLGNSFLLNLTCPTPIETNLTLREIFNFSKAKYKLWYQDEFVVFSPECFVKIKNCKISAFPMKGTINASIKHAEKVILANHKETAEHYTIVDLIRNDLSIIAKDVVVKKFRYIERIRTNQKELLQVSSVISGKLPEDYPSKIGNIILSLLPAGSVTGAPKKKTFEIILETEKYNRGYYTGIFGFFDGRVLDSGVMIRFIEKTKNGLIFKSGGGINSLSDMDEEYMEMIDKVYLPIVN